MKGEKYVFLYFYLQVISNQVAKFLQLTTCVETMTHAMIKSVYKSIWIVARASCVPERRYGWECLDRNRSHISFDTIQMTAITVPLWFIRWTYVTLVVTPHSECLSNRIQPVIFIHWRHRQIFFIHSNAEINSLYNWLPKDHFPILFMNPLLRYRNT